MNVAGDNTRNGKEIFVWHYRNKLLPDKTKLQPIAFTTTQ